MSGPARLGKSNADILQVPLNRHKRCGADDLVLEPSTCGPALVCDRISYQEKAFQNHLVTLGQVAKGIPSPKECIGALACEMIGEPVEPWSPSNKAMMMLVSNSYLPLAGIHAFAFFFNRLSHLLSPCLRRAKSWSLTQVAIIGRPVFLGSIDSGRLWRGKAGRGK